MADVNMTGKPSTGGKAWIWIVVILLLIVIGVGGWYYFIRKSPEGGKCSLAANCESGLTCGAGICSSGKVGSTCSAKTDCKTNYCVSQKCTEGKAGDACQAYADCASGLFCLKDSCSTPADFTKYFNNVIISKIKPGTGPGPNNPETITTTFTTADAIEIDFVGVKSTTIGDFYYEIVDRTTGAISRSSKNEQQLTLSGTDRGTGTSLDNVAPGRYDLNIYFKSELIYSTQITVTK